MAAELDHRSCRARKNVCRVELHRLARPRDVVFYPPMNPPKYARWENERRFLVREDHAGVLSGKAYFRLIEDRYLSCGRLRLRRLTDSDTGAVTLKLTKKYPSESALSQPIVTVLLSEGEHAGLQALPGTDLLKRRYYDEVDGRVFSVDVFEGPLAGLHLCSIETDTLEELQRVSVPRYAGPDVTHDSFYCGGRLCVATREELEQALARVYREPR
jgi:CYTH domain-containing protein